jgi:cobalt-zinc-cadmium efflux system protein
MGMAFAISITILVMEIVGGILSGSLALLSDAGHVFADAVSLGLSWFALNIARRPASSKATFGYHRVGIMVALLNGTTLIVMAVLIFLEAYKRFLSPVHIQTTELLAIAAAGLVANLVMVRLLHGGHQHSLNVRSAWLHVIGDSLASVGVIASGLVIIFTGWTYIDPLISVFIGGLILWGGGRVIREAGAILLELPPRGLDLDRVLGVMRRVPEVIDVHDLHVWTITPQIVALSAHVLVKDQPVTNTHTIGEHLREELASFGIEHATLQFECQDCQNGDTFCSKLNHYDEEDH